MCHHGGQLLTGFHKVMTGHAMIKILAEQDKTDDAGIAACDYWGMGTIGRGKPEEVHPHHMTGRRRDSRTRVIFETDMYYRLWYSHGLKTYG